MSICTPCTQTLPILYCSTTVHIGDWIAGIGVTIQVYFKNTATGRVDNEEVVTGFDGSITVNWIGKMEGASYEVWVNDSTGAMNEQTAYYLPGTTTSVTCLAVSFDRAFTVGVPVSVAISIIEAE